MIGNKEVTNRVGEAGAKKAGATTVLVMAAKELCDYLTRALGGQVTIAAVEGLKEGKEAIEKLKPKLLICAMDAERWETIPLIHNARQHQTPVLVVAYNQEAIASIDSIAWAVDRKRKDAVLAVAKKLLDDPTFVPDDPNRYPPPPPKERNLADNVEVEFIIENADTPPAHQKAVSSIAPKSDAAVFEIVEQLNVRVVAGVVKSIGDRVGSLEALVHDIAHLRESGDKELLEQLKTRDRRFAVVEAKLEGVLKRVEEQKRHSDHLSESVDNRVALVESQLGALVQNFAAVEAKLESVVKSVEAQERHSDHRIQAIGNRVGLVESQHGVLVQTFGAAEAKLESVVNRVEEQKRHSDLFSQSVGNRVALVESQHGVLAQTFGAVEAKLESVVNRVEEQKWHSDQLSESIGNRVELVETQHGTLVQTFGAVEAKLESVVNRIEEQKRHSDHLSASVDNRVDLVESQHGALVQTFGAVEANLESVAKRVDAQEKHSDHLSESVGNRVALVQSLLTALVQSLDETKQTFNNGREAAEKRLEKLELAMDNRQPSDVSMSEIGVIPAQLKDLGLTQIELDDRIEIIEKRLTSFEQTAKDRK